MPSRYYPPDNVHAATNDFTMILMSRRPADSPLSPATPYATRLLPAAATPIHMRDGMMRVDGGRDGALSADEVVRERNDT